MRAAVTIILICATGIFVAATLASSRDQNYAHFAKHRARPREIRGFKPNYMSTAIGFGKRLSFDSSKTNKSERILSILLRYFPRGTSTEWLRELMKTKPLIALRLTQLLLDEHGQFLPSTMDQPNPEQMISLL